MDRRERERRNGEPARLSRRSEVLHRRTTVDWNLCAPHNTLFHVKEWREITMLTTLGSSYGFAAAGSGVRHVPRWDRWRAKRRPTIPTTEFMTGAGGAARAAMPYRGIINVTIDVSALNGVYCAGRQMRGWSTDNRYDRSTVFLNDNRCTRGFAFERLYWGWSVAITRKSGRLEVESGAGKVRSCQCRERLP